MVDNTSQGPLPCLGIAHHLRAAVPRQVSLGGPKQKRRPKAPCLCLGQSALGALGLTAAHRGCTGEAGAEDREGDWLGSAEGIGDSRRRGP